MSNTFSTLLGTVLVLAAVSFGAGCKKEKESIVGPLTQGQWTIVAAEVWPTLPIYDQHWTTISYTGDLWSLWDECRKDDVREYYSDRTLQYYANERCDNQGSGYSCKWELNEDETVLKELYPDGSSADFKVLSVTDTELKISAQEVYNNRLHTVTLIYHH